MMTHSLRVVVLASLCSSSAFAQAGPSSDTPDGVSPSDWASIRTAYEAARHEIRALSADHYRAAQPQQGFSVEFDGRGFTATPDAGGWAWGLELVSYGFEDDQVSVSGVAAMRAERGRMAYRHDDVLEEWYRNEVRAFEHGFTLFERPEHGDVTEPVELSLTLRLRGDLVPSVVADHRSVRFEGTAGEHVLDYAGLVAFDADGRDLPARIEVVPEGIRIYVEQAGARYPLTIDPVVQQAYLKASNTGAGDGFGYSVAISGDTVVVGALFEDSAATGVDGDETDNSAQNSGAAYVFVRSGTTWSQEAYLKASNTGSFDNFGQSIAIDGDVVAVSAHNEDSAATGVDGDGSDNSAGGAGAAYVFVRSGTTWSQQAYLKASNTGGNDDFGQSVGVSGDTVVVGALFEDSAATGVDGDGSDNSAGNSGAAYVFVRNGTTWSQQAYLKASNTGVGDFFGSSVAISGDSVVVGAYAEDSAATGVDGDESDNSAGNSGAAYVFVRSGTTWSQQAYLKASNAEVGDNFGVSVAIDVEAVLVGAWFEDSAATGVDGNESDNSASNSGAAYVFVRGGTTWSQQAYLKASNTGSNDHFGYSVGVSGDSIVVGAGSEDSAAMGVDGDQSDNSAFSAGAAYVFVRSGATWSQQAYLKASNANIDDSFGQSVAIAGDSVVAGAPAEDSAATGVNGDGSDNTSPLSGAAYVFEIDLGGCPSAGIPTLTSPPSSTSSFGISCPTPTASCTIGPVIMFGDPSPIAIPVFPPLGCAQCSLVVNPSWGTLSDGVVVGPGLSPGFSFHVQCACIATNCIDLSQGYTIVVGP